MRKKTISVIASLLICLIVGQPLFAQTVSLAWDRNTESYCAGYNVYRSAQSGHFSVTNKINTTILPQTAAGTTPTYNDSTVSAGTYYYTVTAVNTDGLESGYSNEVMANIKNPTPAAPTGLTITNVSSASIYIDGTKVATAQVGDPLGYIIPRQAPPRSYVVSVQFNGN